MRYLIGLILAITVSAALFIVPNSGKSEIKPVKPAQSGVGALGFVEPRSRIIKVSHDAGPNGARIGELLVKETQRVEKGDTLAVLSDYDLKQARVKAAEANVAVLKARLDTERVNERYSKRELERQQQLVEREVVSVSQLDNAEQQWKTSASDINSLKQEISQAEASLAVEKKELDQSQIFAPISGTVLKIHAREGERIGDEGLLEMADLTNMDIVAEIYESDIPDIRVGQKAEISFPGQSEKFTGELYKLGYIVRGNDLNDTDPLADQDNRVVEVRIAMPEDSNAFLENQIYRKVFVRILK